jgi:hypothetical protein
MDADGSYLDGKGDSLGVIDLHTAYHVARLPPGDDRESAFGFTVHCRDRQWEFWAEDEDQRRVWMRMVAELFHPAVAYPLRHEGWLSKEGGIVKSWKRRRFALTAEHLCYFENEVCNNLAFRCVWLLVNLVYI